MTKRMLADVLWKAANEHLSADHKDGKRRVYSCEAVAAACGTLWSRDWEDLQETIPLRFLHGLGCNTNSLSSHVTADFPSGPERQGVRYMWLLLAMHAAEDEGVEIE